MSSVFTSKMIPSFTKEQKKVKRLANKTHSSRRDMMKPSEAVVVTYKVSQPV